MARRPSRRTILALFAAAGATSAAGAYVFWAGGPQALISAILAYRLPGVKIDSASIAALTRDIQAARFQTFGRRLALESGARVASIVGIEALARWKLTASQFSQLERKVVTFFILGSNFLTVKDPKSDPVTYDSAPDVCPNRFAEYD